LLHDIDKAAVPDAILSKPGPLIDEEWSLIRVHARRGYEALKHSNLPWPVADMALRHHERLDGSGYPDGVGADSLSLEARVLALCDVVEAMSSHRPYRPARTMSEVVDEVRAGRGSKYDEEVADVVLDIIACGEFTVCGGGVSSWGLGEGIPGWGTCRAERFDGSQVEGPGMPASEK